MNDANTSSTAFPAPFSHLQHLLILVWKTGQRNENKAEPGATDHETETRSAPGAGERQRGREKAMVFLDVLVNWGCRRCLHKEDYSFE